MAGINWPPELPLRPGQSGSQQVLGAGTLRADIDQKFAPIWKRQRSTATPDRHRVVMYFTDEQAAVFDNFFCNTTRFGSRRFNWLDLAGTAAECRFVGAPEMTSPMDGKWDITFEYETLK